MQEFDLQKIWKKAEQAANEYYRDIEPEVIRLASQRSNNILRKVLRNSLAELSFTLIFVGFILLFFGSNVYLFWTFLVVGFLAISFSLYIYVELKQKLKAVPQSGLQQALKANIQILSQYINRLYLYTYLFLPIGFYMGTFPGILDHEAFGSPKMIKELLVITAIGIPLLLLTGWFIKKKYIYWLYGRHLEELEEVLTHLEGE